jgi:AcrR family transcriptional regulator
MAGNGATALSAERIVDAALERIEVEGAEALTMRNVARALGATPMSLYRHIRDKAELEVRVVDRVLGGAAATDAEGDWRERVTSLHTGLRQVLLDRPAVGHLAIDCWARSRGRTRIQDRLYAILQDAGFSGPDVVIAADALELYTLGAICRDLSELALSATGESGLGSRVAYVDVDTTPHLVDYAVYLIRRDADVMFASGYAALLEGLEAALTRAM